MLPDAEVRERLELRSKARVGDFVASALTGRGVTGASAEFADSCRVCRTDASGVAGRSGRNRDAGYHAWAKLAETVTHHAAVRCLMRSREPTRPR